MDAQVDLHSSSVEEEAEEQRHGHLRRRQGETEFWHPGACFLNIGVGILAKIETIGVIAVI